MGKSVATELWLCISKEFDEVKDCAVVTVKGPVNNNKKKTVRYDIFDTLLLVLLNYILYQSRNVLFCFTQKLDVKFIISLTCNTIIFKGELCNFLNAISTQDIRAGPKEIKY